jgi:hypothetical protein
MKARWRAIMTRLACRLIAEAAQAVGEAHFAA